MHNALPYFDRVLQASAPVTSGAVLLRLVVAALLGGAIGVERQMKHRPAGLRTNMFMCFGSALFTMLSSLLAINGADPTRIAAQIIAGIGFIGAGSILHSREHVQGVTTAATIFVVAAIGMCAGAGLMIPATLATLLVLFGLLILGILEKTVFARPYCTLYRAEAATAAELYSLLDPVRGDKKNRITDMKMTGQPEVSGMEFTLEARLETHRQLRNQLRAAFEAHKISSFSSSEQE